MKTNLKGLTISENGTSRTTKTTSIPVWTQLVKYVIVFQCDVSRGSWIYMQIITLSLFIFVSFTNFMHTMQFYVRAIFLIFVIKKEKQYKLILILLPDISLNCPTHSGLSVTKKCPYRHRWSPWLILYLSWRSTSYSRMKTAASRFSRSRSRGRPALSFTWERTYLKNLIKTFLIWWD